MTICHLFSWLSIGIIMSVPKRMHKFEILRTGNPTKYLLSEYLFPYFNSNNNFTSDKSNDVKYARYSKRLLACSSWILTA